MSDSASEQPPEMLPTYNVPQIETPTEGVEGVEILDTLAADDTPPSPDQFPDEEEGAVQTPMLSKVNPGLAELTSRLRAREANSGAMHPDTYKLAELWSQPDQWKSLVRIAQRKMGASTPSEGAEDAVVEALFGPYERKARKTLYYVFGITFS